MPKTRFPALTIALLMAAGTGIAAYGVRHLMDVAACRQWPTAVGHVRDASAKPIADHELIPEHKSHDNLVPQIVYEYQVDGKNYWSDAISNLRHHRIFGIADAYYAGNEDEILALLARYPLNQDVTVHYNPLRPAEAVLDPGIKLPNVLPFILGALMMYAACHLYLFGNVFSRHRHGHLTA